MRNRITDYRRVVFAVDREADDFGGAIGGSDGERIDLALPCPEILNGTVGNLVGVRAVRGENERSKIARGRLHRGLEHRLSGIGIADRNDPAQDQERHARVFGDRAIVRIANNCR